MKQNISLTPSSAKKTLRKLSSESGLPSFEASQILEWLLGCSHHYFLLHHEDEASLEIISKFESLSQKRKTGYPLQYLLGEWDFFGLPFCVGEGVLIPRSDTEILVETSLKILSGKSSPQICDLCSGSGCISVALSKNLPFEASLTAVELSEQAFAYLLKNISLNNCNNILPVNADISSFVPDNLFDLIVSNPPYLAKSEINSLQKEVTFEPKLALEAPENGLYFYKIITKKYKDFLKPGGALAFEVGYEQAEAVCEIFKKNNYNNIKIIKDLDKISRVVYAVL